VTPEQYYAEFKKLGLSPTKVPTVFLDADGMTHNVPSPHDKTPEQRAEIVAWKKWQLGVGPKPDVE
jgi:hypothetical protein